MLALRPIREAGSLQINCLPYWSVSDPGHSSGNHCKAESMTGEAAKHCTEINVAATIIVLDCCNTSGPHTVQHVVFVRLLPTPQL